MPTSPKRPCRAVEKRDRSRVNNSKYCHASLSIYMYANDGCLQVLIIILLQIVEDLLSQPSTSAAVTVQEFEDLPSRVSTSTQTQPSCRSIATQTCTFIGMRTSGITVYNVSCISG